MTKLEEKKEKDLITEVLGEREVEKIVVGEYFEDLDSIMSKGSEERPWESFELTQREDVQEWIYDPTKIQKIQPNLKDLSRLLKTLPKPVKIADVGCYGGYLYDYLNKFVFNSPDEFSYTGIDVQEKAVEAASIVHANKSNAEFKVGDVYKLSEQFNSEEFDVVVCSRVIIHIPYYKDAIKNIFDVTKHFSLCILEVSNEPLLQKIHRRVLDTGVELDYFFRKYSEKELSGLAEELEADYRIIKGPSFYSSYCLFKK